MAHVQLANVFRVQKQFKQAGKVLSQCMPFIDRHGFFTCNLEYYFSRIALYHATGQTELKQENETKFQGVLNSAIADLPQTSADLLTKQWDTYFGWMRDNRR